MDAVELGVNLFVTLFALLDPVGNLPIFAAATAGATLRQRVSVSFLICMFAAAFLAFFLFTGLWLLQFFGISLAAFRIAGGILLLLLGLDMAREDFLATFADKDAANDLKDVRGYARRRFQRLVVPFAIPLMIGPGAISAIIIQAGEATKIGPTGTAAALAAIAAACIVSFICFALTGPISRVLGEVGLAIVVRVLGLILCALAIQFILMGLGEALPGIISTGVTIPYPSGGH
jgi:multiple antibiotic resistance protein